jgi:hypothetical protein
MKTRSLIALSTIIILAFITLQPSVSLAACTTQTDNGTVCVNDRICTCSYAGTNKRYYYKTTTGTCTAQNPGDTCSATYKIAALNDMCAHAQSLTKELACGDGCEKDGKQTSSKSVTNNCCTYTKTQKCKARVNTPANFIDLIDPAVCIE